MFIYIVLSQIYKMQFRLFIIGEGGIGWLKQLLHTSPRSPLTYLERGHFYFSIFELSFPIFIDFMFPLRNIHTKPRFLNDNAA